MEWIVTDQWLDYLKLMLILGGVLIVAFLTLRYWMPKLARVNRSTSGPIQVLTRFPLEPNKTLYLLAVGRMKMLVASSEAGVHLVQRLAAEDLEDALNNKPELENENKFERFMQSMKSRKNP